MLRCLLFALLVGICASAGEEKKKTVKSASSLSRGWGQNIKWVKSYEEGLSKMVKSQKPLMVIHHKQDCPHSQALKQGFALDKTIQKMARESFIMLNVVEEVGDPNLALDGYYVPRIVFVDPTKAVRTDIIGVRDLRFNYAPDDLGVCE
ncbi:anterior gradient protein 3 homolog [Stegastes partitus]|uniref:Anterior gradient protein 3 homolog n=1 Tax=Stegastes partitus TaxID=144197 RepID=A0A3B5A0E4_9TELE|nr:PREDICTED: anterior gradient protein 3 homolog [Stegastes partitus]